MPIAPSSSGADCDGVWGDPRTLGESEPFIYVSRCSGCGEQLVTFRHQLVHYFTAETGDAEIIQHALTGRYHNGIV